MNLPDYFLADLPRDATPGPAMIGQACQTLKRNRLQYLAGRSTRGLIQILSDLAGHWLEAEYPFRKLALQRGPAATGFSRETLAAGLEAFFRQVTRENLLALLEQDLGGVQRLDQMTPAGAEQRSNRAAMATAPELLVHLAAANAPTAPLADIILGLVARSAQFVKCAPGTSLLPRLLAHSLYEVEPKLGSCLEVAEWRGPIAELEEALFAEADCVAAAGSHDLLRAIRERIPARTMFIGHGPRISFAYVASGALACANGRALATRAAADVAGWDQMSALGPHVTYVEAAACPPEQFAHLLAEELARIEESEPRGEVNAKTAAGIASRRAFYQVRAAHSRETQLWCSPNSTAWTVVFESDPQFQLSCLHRFIYVKGVKDLAEALKHAESVNGQISTVGLAAPDDSAERLATELARWGVSRVCPLGQMQHPPLAWRRHGRPALADLVRWTDWEK